MIETNVNIRNELNFSDFYGSVNYIRSLAKLTWTIRGSSTLHTTQSSLHFDKSRFKRHKIASKVYMNPDGVHPLCTRPNVVYTSINLRKMKFIELQATLLLLQGCFLPSWCNYIAWFLAFAAVFLSAFFIMLYSMQWGKQKSEEWLTTFLLSFFESVIFLDPIKVLYAFYL